MARVKQAMLDLSLIKKPVVAKGVRFACVGVGATLIHFGVAICLVSLIEVPPVIANAAAVLVATVFSYLVNTLWSFSAPVGRQTLSRFAVVSTLIACIAAAMSALFEHFGLDYRLGVLATVVCIPPVTFWLHHTWTYRVS